MPTGDPFDPPEGSFSYPNPQPTAGALVFGDSLAYDVSCDVYTKQRWADSWVEDPLLICTSVVWSASPSIPTAQLYYRYGQVLEIGDTTETLRTKKNLGGYYVRIVVTCPDGIRLWYGFVDDTADEQHGYIKRIAIEDEIPVTYFDAHGVQTFSCVGIIEALNRDRISTTYFHSTTANETLSGKNIAIALSPPHFNPTEETKNRFNAKKVVPSFTGSTVPSRETYVFHAHDIYNQTSILGDRWSTRDIVEYLVAYAAPRDYINREKIPVRVYYPDVPTPPTPPINPLPDYDFPNLDCEGKTLREALDELMSAKDSLGYWVWVDETSTPDSIYIEPYTLVEADYTVGSSTLARNARQFTLTNDMDEATAFTLQKNESAYANQIVCFGARKQLVLTLKLMTEVVAGWPSNLPDQFTDFVAPDLDPFLLQDQYMIRDMRETGKWRALDRFFKLGPTWNFKYPITASSEDCFTIDQEDYTENFTTPGARYLPFPYRMKLLSYLPLKEGLDYSTGDMKADHKASRQAYRDLEAYGKKHGDDWDGSTLGGKWNSWTKRAIRDILYNNNDPSYYLEINPIRGYDGVDSSIKKKNQELAWGLEINVQGAFQGILNASGALGSGPTAQHVPELPPAQLQLTLAIEDDRRICQYYPSAAPSTVDGVRRRYFDFGDRFQMIELANQAIVAVNGAGDGLLKSDARKFIRDDTTELAKVAKQIAKYYGTVRNVLRTTSRRATAKIWPGQLITQINTTLTGGFTNYHNSTVNCVVSEVSITFPLSNSTTPGRPTFNVVTSKGEIDPLKFIPKVN